MPRLGPDKSRDFTSPVTPSQKDIRQFIIYGNADKDVRKPDEKVGLPAKTQDQGLNESELIDTERKEIAPQTNKERVSAAESQLAPSHLDENPEQGESLFLRQGKNLEVSSGSSEDGHGRLKGQIVEKLLSDEAFSVTKMSEKGDLHMNRVIVVESADGETQVNISANFGDLRDPKFKDSKLLSQHFENVTLSWINEREGTTGDGGYSKEGTPHHFVVGTRVEQSVIDAWKKYYSGYRAAKPGYYPQHGSAWGTEVDAGHIARILATGHVNHELTERMLNFYTGGGYTHETEAFPLSAKEERKEIE